MGLLSYTVIGYLTLFFYFLVTPGIEVVPLHLKHRVLTTVPPGKSLELTL